MNSQHPNFTGIAINSILLYRGGGGLVMNKVTVTEDITAISVIDVLGIMNQIHESRGML